MSREYNASDHNSIFFDLVVDIAAPSQFRLWHSADWDLFRDNLDGGYIIPDKVSVKKLENQ